MEGTERRTQSAGGRAERFAQALLLLAMVTSTAVLLYIGHGQIVWDDALGFAARLGSEPLAHALLQPPSGKYLIVLPLLLYDALFHLFGLGTDFPERVAVVAAVLLCAGLFFVLARRRLGALLALPPTLLLLFFGSGGETLVTASRLPSLIAVAAGLGAMIFLDRRDRRGDVAASILLVGSVTSHPLGLAFLAAGVVAVLLRAPRTGWTLLVPVPAALLYGAWWLFLRAPNPPSPAPTPSSVATFISNSFAEVVANVSGVAGLVSQPAYSQTLTGVVAAALLGLGIVAIALRARRVPWSLWAALVALVVVLASPQFSPGGVFRQPDEVRYMFPAAVVFLWLIVEVGGLFNGSVLEMRPAAWAATGVLLLGLGYNAKHLDDFGVAARGLSDSALGEYSAFELAPDRVDRSWRSSSGDPRAGDYLAAAHAFGSPALPPASVARSAPGTREAADLALVGSLGLRLQTTAPLASAGDAPKVVARATGHASTSASCVRLAPPGPGAVTRAPMLSLSSSMTPAQQLRYAARTGRAPTAPALAELGPLRGPLLFRARPMSRVTVLVGTFFGAPHAQLPQHIEGRIGEFRPPTGVLDRPWNITVASRVPVEVCSVPGAGQSSHP